MQWLSKYPQSQNVAILSPIQQHFEQTYLHIRHKEQRILTDQQVRQLPHTNPSTPHHHEWQMRAKSLARIQQYLATQQGNLLDIGCGNGWFTQHLTHTFNGNILGIDINLTELAQATRLFSNTQQLQFAYANIFNAPIPPQYFTHVTINAAIQYFPSIPQLLQHLQHLLAPPAQVHILDSPWYPNTNAQQKAQQRTQQYYNYIQTPQMTQHYHHHTLQAINPYPYHIHYNPYTTLHKIKKIIHPHHPYSPFLWLHITLQKH